MRQVTASGQTVDEAVQSALEQLNTSRDQVNIEVIDEGKKGIFGIFGSKRAIVKVSMVNKKYVDNDSELEESKKDELEKEDYVTIDRSRDHIEDTKRYLQQVAAEMGVPIEVETHQKDRQVTFDLVGDKIAILIGKRGQTLNALQYLAHLVVNRHSDQYFTVIVDAEGYRARRKGTLVNLANRLADKAVHTQKDIALEPMPSYERKVIHTALQNNNHISTFSDGVDPHRHVVIKPVKRK